MNIKLTEYIGASTIALSVKDVPLSALSGIKEAFVRLCETVETFWEPSRVAFSGGHEVMVATEEQQEAARQVVEGLIKRAGVGHVMPEASPVDKPKRGRPRKTQEDKEPAGERVSSVETVDIPSALPEPVSDVGQILKTPTAFTEQSESQATPISPEPTPPAELPEITDSELQKYCAKLAAHFGDPKKVFDLAQPFVPEGAVARPTNIKDNVKRHEFIQAAEAASGVKYHG